MCSVLLLHELDGYVRTTVEIPGTRKKTVDPKEVQTAVRQGIPSLGVVRSACFFFFSFAVVVCLAHAVRAQDSRLVYVDNPKLADALADFEEKSLVTGYKFGVLYMAPNQSTEEDMYNNTDGSTAYQAFLDLIGTRVALAKHQGFRGGLDCMLSVCVAVCATLSPRRSRPWRRQHRKIFVLYAAGLLGGWRAAAWV